MTEPPRCERCDSGEVDVDGWHFADGRREVCIVHPPRFARIVTDPSKLTLEEKQALLRVGEVLGPLTLDVEGALRMGDYI